MPEKPAVPLFWAKTFTAVVAANTLTLAYVVLGFLPGHVERAVDRALKASEDRQHHRQELDRRR